MRSPVTIGIVGTAKNTGKTTTLSFLIHAARQRMSVIGLTGIGYDGEEIDAITSLPKPRLFVEEGMIVATSERCLQHTEVVSETLIRTGFRTALGEVLIAKIVRGGLLVLAGPNTIRSLKTTLEQMSTVGIDCVMVDGSLNRIAPMSVVQKMIMTTGGARSTDIGFLAEEMKGLQTIFDRSVDPGTGGNRISVGSLIDSDDVNELLKKISSLPASIEISLMVSSGALVELNSALASRAYSITSLTVPDPIALVLAGEPIQTASILQQYESQNIPVLVRHSPTLAAITINPFYPALKNFTYASAFLDKQEMIQRFREKISLPVFNMKDGGSSELLQTCLS